MPPDSPSLWPHSLWLEPARFSIDFTFQWVMCFPYLSSFPPLLLLSNLIVNNPSEISAPCLEWLQKSLPMEWSLNGLHAWKVSSFRLNVLNCLQNVSVYLKSSTINNEAVQHVIIFASSKISFHNFKKEWLWRWWGRKRLVPAGEYLATTLYWRVYAEGLGQPFLEHEQEDHLQSGSQPRKRWRPSNRSVTRVDRIKC